MYLAKKGKLILGAIDILMATYNGEKYIAEQVESLQKQTFTDWRLLVADDGSTDRTLEIIRKMQTKDSRIEFAPAHEPFHSSTKNFLYLLEKSTAPYVMFCDQDDVWLPEKIEHTFAKMKEAERSQEVGKAVLVYADSRVVNENLEVTEPSFMHTVSFRPETYNLYKSLVANICQGATMMLNRPLANKVNNFSIPDAYPQHDYWVAAIALACGSLGFLDEQTLLYRQHSSNDVGVMYVLSPLGRLKSILKTLISVDWIKDMAASESAYVNRARAILNADLALKNSDVLALNEIVQSSERNYMARIKILKRYQMFKDFSLYKRFYQAAGILFSCLGA